MTQCPSICCPRACRTLYKIGNHASVESRVRRGRRGRHGGGKASNFGGTCNDASSFSCARGATVPRRVINDGPGTSASERERPLSGTRCGARRPQPESPVSSHQPTLCARAHVSNAADELRGKQTLFLRDAGRQAAYGSFPFLFLFWVSSLRFVLFFNVGVSVPASVAVGVTAGLFLSRAGGWKLLSR